MKIEIGELLIEIFIQVTDVQNTQLSILFIFSKLMVFKDKKKRRQNFLEFEILLGKVVKEYRSSVNWIFDSC